jgi:enoyl-CoA hydratase/carnithine racemase
MADLEYSREDGVATILLNRPGRKNAFTGEMIDSWASALREAASDPAVRVVVLRGAGAAFCSGVDLDTIGDQGTDPLKWKNFLHDRVQQVPRAVAALDKPLIASIGGPAVGAGMDMALMCDMRVAAESATFCESYIRVGMVPGAGGCWFLPRIVGMAKAMELFLTADFVDAEEALRIGLVNRVVADEELVEQTYSLAGRIAAGPPITTRLLKRMLHQSARSDLETALELASSHMGVARSTEDAAESLAAFRERRAPEYRGR